MKVSIVGVGVVGATTAFSIAERGLCDEIALIDPRTDQARGDALDLRHGVASLPTDVEVNGSSDYRLSENSDLIIIPAGIPRKPGETRTDLAAKNIGITKEILGEVRKYNSRPLVLVVTNPVDIATLAAVKYSGYPTERVFGLGTMLDTIRLESLIAAAFNVSVRSVYAPILGEHGETMFPAYSNGFIRDTPIRKFPGASSRLLDGIFKNAMEGGARVIKMKGGTSFAPALAIAEVVECVTQNKDRVMPLSVYSRQHKLCVGLLARVNRSGAYPLKIDLNAGERKKMGDSVAALTKVNKACGLM